MFSSSCFFSLFKHSLILVRGITVVKVNAVVKALFSFVLMVEIYGYIKVTINSAL